MAQFCVGLLLIEQAFCLQKAFSKGTAIAAVMHAKCNQNERLTTLYTQASLEVIGDELVGRVGREGCNGAERRWNGAGIEAAGMHQAVIGNNCTANMQCVLSAPAKPPQVHSDLCQPKT